MDNTKTYTPEIVKEIQKAHANQVFEHAFKFASIQAHLAAYAQTLWDNLCDLKPHAFAQVSNYHPDYLGKDAEYLKKANLTFKDCQLTTAANFGFNTWEQVEHLGNLTYNTIFESAINHLIRGETEALKRVIAQYPDIVKMHSQYGHKATILHYASSNGVEMWRQQVPENLPELIKILIEAGADPNAKMHVYNNNLRTLDLLKTSAHPTVIGVGEESAKVLEESAF